MPIKITFHRFITMQLQRNNDCLFRPLIINLQLYTPAQLCSINRVRLYLHVVTLADVYTGNGTKFCSTLSSNNPIARHSTYQWPVVKPAPVDFTLWRDSLMRIRGCRSLGDWVSTGHSISTCSIFDPVSSKVYIKQRNKLRQYGQSSNSRPIRTQSNYSYILNVKNPIKGYRGTYRKFSCTNPFVRRSSSGYIHQNTTSYNIIWYFLSWGESWVWTHFSIQGNGLWLPHAIAEGTVILACDGSYQPKMSTLHGTAAWIILCTRAGQKAIVVTPPPTETVNAYRSEIMVLYVALSTILTVTKLHHITQVYLKIRCDNEKGVYLASLTSLQVPLKFKHLDIFHSINIVWHLLPIKIDFQHVLRHQDDSVVYLQLPRMSQLNVDCDHLAKRALLRFSHTNQKIPYILPHEQVIVIINGQKLLGILVNLYAMKFPVSLWKHSFIKKNSWPSTSWPYTLGLMWWCYGGSPTLSLPLGSQAYQWALWS